jgi:hypothetical protein
LVVDRAHRRFDQIGIKYKTIAKWHSEWLHLPHVR